MRCRTAVALDSVSTAPPALQAGRPAGAGRIARRDSTRIKKRKTPRPGGARGKVRSRTAQPQMASRRFGHLARLPGRRNPLLPVRAGAGDDEPGACAGSRRGRLKFASPRISDNDNAPHLCVQARLSAGRVQLARQGGDAVQGAGRALPVEPRMPAGLQVHFRVEPDEYRGRPPARRVGPWWGAGIIRAVCALGARPARRDACRRITLCDRGSRWTSHPRRCRRPN